MNEQQDDLDTHVIPLPLDITDPGNWKIIDQNLIDMLVKRGPSKVKVDNFPKDSENRHFSSTHLHSLFIKWREDYQKMVGLLNFIG